MVGIEAGHPGVAVGNLAKALDALGLLAQIDGVAEVSQDPFVVDAGLRRLSPRKPRHGR